MVVFSVICISLVLGYCIGITLSLRYSEENEDLREHISELETELEEKDTECLHKMAVFKQEHLDE